MHLEAQVRGAASGPYGKYPEVVGIQGHGYTEEWVSDD